MSVDYKAAIIYGYPVYGGEVEYWEKLNKSNLVDNLHIINEYTTVELADDAEIYAIVGIEAESTDFCTELSASYVTENTELWKDICEELEKACPEIMSVPPKYYLAQMTW